MKHSFPRSARARRGGARTRVLRRLGTPGRPQVVALGLVAVALAAAGLAVPALSGRLTSGAHPVAWAAPPAATAAGGPAGHRGQDTARHTSSAGAPAGQPAPAATTAGQDQVQAVLEAEARSQEPAGVPTAPSTSTAPKAPKAPTATTPVQAGRATERQAAAGPIQGCGLVVPAAPLTARGLTTPYRLTGVDPEAGPCTETGVLTRAYVEATIFDPATATLSVYRPLVVDDGTEPALPPVPVTLPPGAVVGIWFGFSGEDLTLTGAGATSCVNGLPGSIFGQFAYCNAPVFFRAANAAIAAGRLVVPPLGTGRDGLPCPTVRDFSVIDQDQSDNVSTIYRVVGGRVAQDMDAARSGRPLASGSDENLLARGIDEALGCRPFTAPDLTAGGEPTPSLALNELAAGVYAGSAPMALVPVSDPMTQVGGQVSVAKTDLYRAGVNQPPLPTGQDPQTYCRDIATIGNDRLTRDAALFQAYPAPEDANLYETLTKRLASTLTSLGCG